MRLPPFPPRYPRLRATPEAALRDALTHGTGWCTAANPSDEPQRTAAEILAMMEDAKRAAMQLAGVTFWRGFDRGAPEGDQTVLTMATLDRARQHHHNQRAARQASDIPSFLCPRCGARSFNAHDIQHRYCGRCHVFVDDEIARDLREGGLPLVERVDGADVFDYDKHKGRLFFGADVAALPAPATPEPVPEVPLIRGELGRMEGLTLVRQRGERARELWWGNYEESLVSRLQVQWLRTQHDPVAVQAQLETLLRFRADATRHPGKLPIADFWRWREACLQSRRDAGLVGMARGGFSPSPVRWICLTWWEPEPRRSRMLGIPAPHFFGNQ